MADALAARWRSLAKDGARRQEIRAICADEVLIDYSGASWRELLTLEMVAEECAALAVADIDPKQWGLRDHMETTGDNVFLCTCGDRLYPDCDMSAASIGDEFVRHLIEDHNCTRAAIERAVASTSIDQPVEEKEKGQ